MAPKSLQIRSRARLGASWRFLAPLGALLRLSGPLLAPLGALLAPLGGSWGVLKRLLAEVSGLCKSRSRGPRQECGAGGRGFRGVYLR